MKSKNKLMQCILSLFLLTLVFNQSICWSGNKEEIREALIPQIHNMDTIPVNTDMRRVTYQTLQFSKPLFQKGTQSYFAVKFEVPVNGGHLYYSQLEIPKTEANTAVVGYQLAQINGPEVGFSGNRVANVKNVPGVTYAVLHKVNADLFVPNQEYILYFTSFSNKPFKVKVSLNFLQDKDVAFEDLFSEYIDF